MTGMRKIMEKCRSWCSKEDKTEEVGQVERGRGARATETETAFAGRGDSDWTRHCNMRLEELLLVEMQRATCLNCNLIAMGEMLPYADGRCPRCGNMTTTR